MREVVIVDAVRSPLGRRGGWLREWHPVRLGSEVLQGLLKRTNLPGDKLEHVVWGVVSQVGEQAFNVARNTVLDAGLPIEIAATSIDFQCGSGQQAVHLGAALVASGQYDVVVSGGVESMSRVPLFSSKLDQEPFTPRMLERFEMIHQGIASDKIAKQWGLAREALDRIGHASHDRAAKATEAGHFAREIIPVEAHDDEGKSFTMDRDQGIRPNVSLEKMGELKPVFTEDGVTTAGNSSQVTDGAAAVLLTTPEKARELGLTPRARILRATTVGSDPHLMLTGPVAATRKVLSMAGMTMNDIDLVEINEAFASVVAMWRQDMDADLEKVNVHGGAIAIGHPLGASGARVTTTLLNALETGGKAVGLQTICCGGGMATGMIVERV